MVKSKNYINGNGTISSAPQELSNEWSCQYIVSFDNLHFLCHFYVLALVTEVTISP
jgi:hypothetical protein